MKTIDFSYFIERYNAGEMSEAEKKWFRKELDGSQKLQEEFDLRKRTDEVLKSQNIISLRNKLSEIERSRAVQLPVRNSKKRVYLKYASVIAGLVLIGSISLFLGSNLSSEEIISKYYRLYEPPTELRSGTSENDSDSDMALKFFNTHDYRNAAIFSDKVLESNPEYMQTIVLKGVANYEEKKYADAIESFEKVINNNDNLFIEVAQYYLAWCYLQTDEKEKAIQQFEIIKKEDGIYGNDANKIIRNIK